MVRALLFWPLLWCGGLLLGCSPDLSEAQLRPPETWRVGIASAASGARENAAHIGRSSRETLRRVSPHVAYPPLAAAVRASRRHARTGRLEDVPASVRAELKPYFDDDLLDAVRWSLAGRGLDLGSLLAGWYYEEGAVTLYDTVVFSDREVTRNLWLWAHELAHIEQYRRMGIDGFAYAYVTNWRVIEGEANGRAYAITADIRAKRAREAERAVDLPEPVDAAIDWVQEAFE